MLLPSLNPARPGIGRSCVPYLAATILLLAAPFAAHSAHAAAAGDTAVVQLEPVVVTGVAPSAPLTITTDPRLARQPVPASDGTDYLRTIPGFSAIRNGGTNGDLVLRGMFGSRVNVLANGACMQGACPGRMDAPTSYIAPESFERLTVIKGPETVAWGPGSSAGTVRFERNTEAFAAPGVRLGSSMLGGSWGRNDQLADFSAGTGAGYARVTANRAQSNDYADGEGKLVPSGWMKWNVDGALGWTPRAASRLELDAGTGDGNARYAGRGMDGTRFQRQSVGMKYEQAFERGTLQRLEASASYHVADHVMDNYSMRTPDPMSAMPMAMAANVGRLTLASRIAATLNWRDDVRVLAGADYSRNQHRGRSSVGDAYRSQPWIEDASFANLGPFAELSWTAASHSHVTAGARVDVSSAEDQRAMTGGMMPLANPTFGRTRSVSLPSGFLRVVQDLTPQAAVYAGFGHAERFPDYWELFSPDNGPMGSVNAFSAIRSERTTQLDAGAHVVTANARGWMSLYAGLVSDYVLFEYTTGGMMGPASSARNVNARTAGGEAGIAGSLARSVHADASVAFAWGENRTDGVALAQVPPLETRWSLAYDDRLAWSAGALLRLVAPQHRVAIDEGNVVGRDLGESPGFGIVSLNGSRRLPGGFRLAAGIDNVLDRTYSEHLNLAGDSAFGYPANPVRIHEPGRTVWIKLSVKA